MQGVYDIIVTIAMNFSWGNRNICIVLYIIGLCCKSKNIVKPEVFNNIVFSKFWNIYIMEGNKNKVIL